MLVEIQNWEKYNPRHDVKHTTWFRLENTFWADSALTPLDSDGKMVWLILLAFASQKQCGTVDVDVDFMASVIKADRSKVDAALAHFQALEKIKIPTSRGRNVRVTPTSRPRDAHVPLRDGTRRDETGRNEPPPYPRLSGRGTNPERKRRRWAKDHATAIATKIIGAARNRLDQEAAADFIGHGWALMLAKYGAWDGFMKAYVAATTQRRSGGSDATTFESQLKESLRALLLEAPPDYNPQDGEAS